MIPRLAVVFVLCWSAASFADLPVGEQVIHTKDGRELRGVVTSQTDTAYVVQTSGGLETIPFTAIQDILPAEGAPPQPLPPPPPPPPPNQGPPPPGYDVPEPPPQPRAEPNDQPEPEPPETEQPQPDWRADRKGFHWSIGVGGMVDPGIGSASSSSPVVAGFVGAVPAVRWGLGWLDIQAEVMPMGFFKGATKAFFLGANPQLRINFARFYSLGVGLYGAVVISPGVDFCLGPSFSPAIFRLGKLGEHEVRFWVASPAVATSNALKGTLLFLLSYSYVF